MKDLELRVVQKKEDVHKPVPPFDIPNPAKTRQLEDIGQLRMFITENGLNPGKCNVQFVDKGLVLNDSEQVYITDYVVFEKRENEYDLIEVLNRI